MTDPYLTVIEVLVRETEQLFAKHGLSIRLLPGRRIPHTGRQALGTIGFGGADMKGMLAVLADISMWRAVAPPDFPSEDHLLADLVGEMANMLLGRCRNALLGHGAALAAAIPTALCGSDLALHRSEPTKPDWLVFSSDAGLIFVRIHVAFRKDFRFIDDNVWSLRPNDADLVLF